MKKSILGFILILLLLTTFTPKIEFIENLNFKPYVKSIRIENNLIVESETIKTNLNFLYDRNLLFIKNKDIERKLIKEDFIDSFSLKRIYPDTLIIKIFEKKPIAILQNKKRKFIITSKGDLIAFKKIEGFYELPIVFGEDKAFFKFYKNIKNSNFPLNQIKSFYFFESKRWDLLLHDGILIKLPTENYISSLNNFIELKNENIHNKYKVFDYRIINQLILN